LKTGVSIKAVAIDSVRERLAAFATIFMSAER
jgi:hypothetical protein